MLEQLRRRDESSIIDINKYVEDLRAKGLLPKRDLPSKVILLYTPSLIHAVRKKYQCDRQPFFTGEIDFVTLPSAAGQPKEIAIVHRLGFGAPSMALFVEKLFALGAREFVIVGTAGALEADLQVGDIVLGFTALRDEGVSEHYLPKSQNVAASMQIVTALKSVLSEAQTPYFEKAVWTTDAFYRETKSAVAGAIKMGAGVVDMEAAALYAMCEYHLCKGAAVFVVSDHVGTDDWVPQFSDVAERQLYALDLVVKALAKT